MKVLIWFGCFFTVALIQTLARNAGIILGGIPTALLFGLAYWSAQKLCRKWEINKVSKAAAKEGVTPFVYVKNQTPTFILDQLECKKESTTELQTFLNQCVKGKSISQIHADFLFDGYTKK